MKGIEKTIQILYATDKNAVLELSASIISLLKNANIDTRYEIHIIIDNEVSQTVQKNLKLLEKVHPGTKISFINMIDGAFSDVIIHTVHITKATFYRLFAGELLPNVERCLYLDCDTIILKDLSSFYNIDIKDYMVAGVKAAAYYYPEQSKRRKEQELGIKIETYINAGVLLMNLAKIRKEGMLNRFIELSKKNFTSEDQDVMNVACYGNIKTVPLKCNAMVKYFAEESPDIWKAERLYSQDERREAAENPLIIHYANKDKPWNKFLLYKADVWFKYAEVSPFFNNDYYPLLGKYQEYRKKNKKSILFRSLLQPIIQNYIYVKLLRA